MKTKLEKGGGSNFFEFTHLYQSIKPTFINASTRFSSKNGILIQEKSPSPISYNVEIYKVKYI